jgi:parallel beta helix pectate lyase-like protein
MYLRLALVIFTLLTLLTSAQAATLVVRLDGSGNYLSIAEAIEAAMPDDTILVGPGTYNESLDITKSLTLESESGKSVTVLDGQDSIWLMKIEVPCNVTIRGFLFTNAYSTEGSALYIAHQPTVLVEDCSFVENYATGSNAVHARHDGTSLTIRNCEFLRNSCAVHSAALSIGIGGYLGVYDCTFAENTAPGTSAAVNVNSAQADFDGNLFYDNSGAGAGALNILSGSVCTVTRNTFHGNSGGYGSVFLAGPTLFEKNIITGELTGPGLDCDWRVLHTCNLYYDNLGGSIYEGGFGESELEMDPLYCDWQIADFTLSDSSPALAIINECGDMGALGVGCNNGGVIATEKTSFGELKSLFR